MSTPTKAQIKEVEKAMEKLAKKCKQLGIVNISAGYHGMFVTLEADHWAETEENTT